MWRFLKGKRHLTASVPLYTNWRTAIDIGRFILLHTYAEIMYIYTSATSVSRSAPLLCPRGQPVGKMKVQRLNAIREVLARASVASQDELRRKLRRRGIRVTQATLSRDIHELRLSKGPGGYSLANGSNGAATETEDDRPPSLVEMIDSLGLRVRRAMNQVVLSTAMGGAQPVAAAMDREGWPEVVGTIAGDDTVLVICIDARHAGEVEARLRTMLQA
jgi:transcriptional regulator of arginine metabolism